MGGKEENEIKLITVGKAMDEAWKLEDAGIEIKDLVDPNNGAFQNLQVFFQSLVRK